MNRATDICPQTPAPPPAAGLLALLAWVRLWMMALCPGHKPEEVGERTSHRPNMTRHHRHMVRRVTPPSRNCQVMRRFFDKGLSQRQFLERASRISVLGRFQLFDFLYYRHDFWRANKIWQFRQAYASRTRLQNAGLWDTHLWPS